MKGFLAVLILLLLGLTGYNTWEIRNLRQELAATEAKLNEQRQSTDLLTQATAALAAARTAVSGADFTAAQNALNGAKEALGKVGERAQPALKWLEQQASDVGRQIQTRLNGAPPAPAR